MSFSRRNFIKNMTVGLGSMPLIGINASGCTSSRKGDSAKLLIKDPDHPQPSPKGYDRLPLEWYKNTVKRLKENVSTKGVDVIVLEDQWNMVYFSGNFMTKTERPLWLVFPVKLDAIFWYTPALDNEIVKSWWCTEMD